MRTSIAVGILVCFVAFASAAAPVITASCPGCIRDGDVLSVPLGAQTALQVSDAQTPPIEAVWTFSDGGKAYGIATTYAFQAPGRYTVEVLAIYGTDTLPVSAQLTVHVVAAPPASAKGTLFGLPNEITYPVLSALATAIASLILYYLGG